jgi:heme-degrading monooxygenase HmoA
MYARVLTAPLVPDRTGELTDTLRNSIMPAARQQQGFKGAILLTDPTTQKVMYISLWETEADLRASETVGYVREQLGKVGHLFDKPPAQDIYQVDFVEI